MYGACLNEERVRWGPLEYLVTKLHMCFDMITIVLDFAITLFYGQMFGQLGQRALDAKTKCLRKSSAYFLEAHCSNLLSTARHKSRLPGERFIKPHSTSHKNDSKYFTLELNNTCTTGSQIWVSTIIIQRFKVCIDMLLLCCTAVFSHCTLSREESRHLRVKQHTYWRNFWNPRCIDNDKKSDISYCNAHVAMSLAINTNTKSRI